MRTSTLSALGATLVFGIVAAPTSAVAVSQPRVATVRSATEAPLPPRCGPAPSSREP